MTTSPPSPPPTLPVWSRLIGGLISIAVPGGGQCFQGVVHFDPSRLAKGLFFLLALCGMFFYGMYLGKWKNVWLPHWQEYCLEAEHDNESPAGTGTVRFFGYTFYPLPADMYTRLQFVGQLPIGLPAWPALWNYYKPDQPILTNYYPESPGGKLPDAKDVPPEKRPTDSARRKVNLDRFELETNNLHRDMGKMWDIAWVYTVLAGVLNVLVIYDAFAGPFYPRRGTEPAPPADEGQPAGGAG